MKRAVILGAGPMSIEIIERLYLDSRFELNGVVDSHPDAPGLTMAARYGIPVSHEIEPFVADLDLVMNLTGETHQLDAMKKILPAKVDILNGKNALFLIDLLSGSRWPEIPKHDSNSGDGMKAIKRLYLDLEQSKEQIEKVSQAVNSALIGISQDMRSTINLAMGYTDLLKSTYLDPVQKDYLSLIHNSTDSLLLFIEELHDLTTVESHKIQLDMIDFDLEHLLDSVVRQVNFKLQGKDFRVISRIDQRNANYFTGDPTRIKQILFNLLSNTLINNPLHNIEIFVEADTSEEMLPMEELEDGFDMIRFQIRYQTEDELMPSGTDPDLRFSGSMLARKMSIKLSFTKAQALVYKMGGEIRLEYEKQGYRQYSFTLRLKKAKPIADIEPLPEKSLSGKRVIIADLSKESRDLLSSQCSKYGIKIAGLASGGLDTFMQLGEIKKIPDLAIIDVNLPGMSGYELASRIRRRDEFNSLKLLAISGEPVPGLAKKSHESGFDGYLSKPVSEADLIPVIRSILGDQRPQGQIITRHLAHEISMKSIKVLVAEENVVNRKLIQSILNKMGVAPRLVGNGLEAVELVKTERFDLVFMDAQMPVMNGLDATRKIKNLKDRSPVIIVLASILTLEEEANLKKLGVDEIILRPVTDQIIKEKIGNWQLSQLS